ncbi:MAG: FAD-dependent oxidoreductase, partial [Gordonia sp. (in: high G+C Gram-positive bacteria)]
MPYVITQRCCNDATCIDECPVDCIRPTPSDPDFATAEMLYIEPDTCIDCGACADACPVGAIFPTESLADSLSKYPKINADYFQSHPLVPDSAPISKPARPSHEAGPLRVAIVGAGAAAGYTAEDLLSRGNVEIDIFDRLPSPWGLVRYGVAPDHPETKEITDGFTAALARDSVQFHLNVDVGRDITHAELLEHYHAVIYAVGASADKRMGIPGEDLPGSHSATEFVAWYNGHPDYADRTFDLSGERAVVIGNGNVALDVARILCSPHDRLASTDIADHALAALQQSRISEVVIVGRRGVADAAFTSPEFLALGNLPDVDVIVDPADLEGVAADAAFPASLKLDLAREYAGRTRTEASKRIVFQFLRSPERLAGDDRVSTIDLTLNRPAPSPDGTRIEPTDNTESLSTGLVLRAIGYRGQPIAGLPFDDGACVVPNTNGRVEPGVYVTGWIKRGA